MEFKENLRVLIISVLFIVLSGRIALSELHEALLPGVTLLIVLVVVVRPLSVFGANLFSRQVSLKEQIFLSAMAPRGIVAAAVTAFFSLEFEHAIDHGDLDPAVGQYTQQMVPIVFIVIIGTVAFYGILSAPLARRLGLASDNPRGILFAGAGQWVRLAAKALKDDGHDILLLDTNYDNVARAKLDGLPVTRANILSEYVEDELELTGLGQLITTTPNDEVNSLAAHHFIHIFGRENVWQVAPMDDDGHQKTAVAPHMRGRICFPSRPQYKKLERFAATGGVIKKTTITKQFTLEDFCELYGKEHILLFWTHEDKGLQVAHDNMRTPSPGTTVYAMIRPEDA